MKIKEILKELILTIDIEKRRSNKSFIELFFDIIYSRFKYGTIVCDYMAYGFSILPKKYRKYYLTSHQLIKFVNSVNNREIDNKYLSYELLKPYYKRMIVNIEKDDLESIYDFLNKNKSFFAKKLVSSGGYGVKYLKTSDFKDYSSIIDYLRKEELLMLEEEIIQHAELNKLNPSCINTLRIVSVLNDKNEVLVLPAIIRVGLNNNKVDNVSFGGSYTLIDDEGKVIMPGFYQENISGKNHNLIIPIHPVTKINPLNFKLPYYQESVEMVKEMAKLNTSCVLVGWDIALSDSGPKLLEFNTFPGIDMNQNYYFISNSNKKHSGVKEIIEKHLGRSIG